MSIFLSTLSLAGVRPQDAKTFPQFRERNHDQPLLDGGLTPEELPGFRSETGFRMLPYSVQDTYSRKLKALSLKTVVFENEHLKAVFVPEYGGRLWSLFDKDAGRELLFCNSVFRPANLAIRNAWFSGGIEWNLGQFGHWCLTCSPVYFARCTAPDGEEFLRMYEYERQKGFFFQIDFHLPPNAHCLFAHMRIQNSHESAVPLYYWTNIAVQEDRLSRIASGCDDVIYIRPESLEQEQNAHSFAHGKMPFLPPLNGADASYPQSIPYSCEYFFQNPPALSSTWECAAYRDNYAMWERSTTALRYRKMFCWGNNRGGNHWKDYLSQEGHGNYLEIQAGMAPSQVHCFPLEGGGIRRFTQAFGGMQTNDTRVCGTWHAAQKYLAQRVEESLSAQALLAYDSAFVATENTVPTEILTFGSGWGALEGKRSPASIPPGTPFPASAIGPEQAPWLELLQQHRITPPPHGELPPSWMTDPRWISLVEQALQKSKNQDALLWLHLGVMRYENGDYRGGEEAFLQAEAQKPNALSAYCLAQCAAQENNFALACRHIEAAWQRQTPQCARPLAAEYLLLHNKAGNFNESWRFYTALSPALQADERIALTTCNAAFACAQWSFLEQQFETDFAVIREGEGNLLHLWFLRKAMLLAQERGVPESPALLLEVRQTAQPPYRLDFRMTPPPQPPIGGHTGASPL